MADDQRLSIQRVLRIRSSPARVLAAFFDPRDLAAWWEVSQAVVVPRPLAPYAVQWPPTAFRDEVLGRLGGTLHGLTMDYRHGAGAFLAEVYYTPPESAPIGPMALAIDVEPLEGGRATELTVKQSAEAEDGERRLRHYFTLVAGGWDRALDALREHLEWSGTRPRQGHTWEAPE